MKSETNHEVLQLAFDAEGQALIQVLWTRIENLIGRSIRDILGWPHVSLTSSSGTSICDKRDEIGEAFRKSQLSSCKPTHLGIFPGPQSVLFLGLSPSPRLVDLQQALCRILEGPGVVQSPFYQPGLFVPHASLATGLSQDELHLVLREISAESLPRMIVIHSLELVRYFPAERMFACSLE